VPDKPSRRSERGTSANDWNRYSTDGLPFCGLPRIATNRRGTGKAIVALAREFLGIIYRTLKNNWVFEDFRNFVLAERAKAPTAAYASVSAFLGLRYGPRCYMTA